MRALQRFMDESGLIVDLVSSGHMGLFKRQVFAFVNRQRSDMRYQSVGWILKIQNYTPPRPSRLQVVLRSAPPVPRLLPASGLMHTTASTMVGFGVGFAAVCGD